MASNVNTVYSIHRSGTRDSCAWKYASYASFGTRVRFNDIRFLSFSFVVFTVLFPSPNDIRNNLPCEMDMGRYWSPGCAGAGRRHPIEADKGKKNIRAKRASIFLRPAGPWDTTRQRTEHDQDSWRLPRGNRRCS